MKKIKIMQEFLHGPLWYYNDDDIAWERNGLENFATFVGDKELNEIADRINELFSSYYEFDSHDVACWFNHEQEKKDKDIMLDLLGKLRKRLDELNDGSFEIIDYATKRAMKL